METAKAYAEALFLLGEEEGRTEEYLQALDTVWMLLREEPDYIGLLASPAIPLHRRLEAVEDAFGGRVPEDVVSFLKLLCEHGRIPALPGCVDEFGRLVRAKAGRTIAKVSSAVPLSEEQKKAVSAKLEKRTGKQVELRCTVDETLIGGLKIELDGRTYDGSVKHRLREVKGVMMG